MDWLCCFWDLCWSRSHFPIEDLFSQTLSRTFDTIFACDVFAVGGLTTPPPEDSIYFHPFSPSGCSLKPGSLAAAVHFGAHGQEFFILFFFF